MVNSSSINKCSNILNKDSRKKFDIFSPLHKLHKKKYNTVNDYSNKSIDDFKLDFVDPSPNFTDKRKQTIESSFGPSS